MLTININSIKSDPESFITEIAGSNFNPQDEKLFEDKVTINILLYRSGEQVIVKGKVETLVSLNCGRCLVDYKQPLIADMYFIVRLDNQQKSDDQEELINADDTGFVICHGDQLDLIPEIKSALILALPMKPLCGESCHGLCNKCGTNLNIENCTCSQQRSQTPFAMLKDLITKEQSE